MFPFKVLTTVGESENIALNNAIHGARRKVFAWILVALAVIYLAFAVYVVWLTDELKPMYVICPAFLLLIALYYALLLPLLLKKQVKKHLERNGTTVIEYEFFEDSFTDDFKSGTSSGSNSNSYSSLIKVVETDCCFFLFRTALTAFVVDKSRMDEAQKDALRGVLKRFVPAGKYKLKNK